MTCDGCHAVAATVHVTVRRNDGQYATGHLCESCFQSLSRDRVGDFAPMPPEPQGSSKPHQISIEDYLYRWLGVLIKGLSVKDVRAVAEATAREVERRGGTPSLSL